MKKKDAISAPNCIFLESKQKAAHFQLRKYLTIQKSTNDGLLCVTFFSLNIFHIKSARLQSMYNAKIESNRLHSESSDDEAIMDIQ